MSICPTSRCRPISPRAWRCCARCRPRCRSIASTAIAAVGTDKAARGRVLHGGRRAAAAGRSAAAAPGRRAQRQPRQCGRRRACLERPPALLRAGRSTRISRSSVPGIAVAGDGAGIAGGTAAAERGRIAAIAAVRALRPDAPLPRSQSDPPDACSARRWAAPFLDWLYRPAERSVARAATRSSAAARR